MVDTINDLSDLSRRLNQKSDTLNDTIASINQKLATLNLGVETWLAHSPIERSDPYYGDDDEHGNFPLHDEIWLGYFRFDTTQGQHGSGWALAAKAVVLQRAKGDKEAILEAETKPLLSASRETRVTAMRLIPDLLDAIKRKAEELLQSIDKAEMAARSLAGEAIKLNLRKVANTHSGAVLGSGETYQYAVTGLPQGQEAMITNFGKGNQPSWRILRIVKGVQGSWTGKHETATHALAALQREVEMEGMVGSQKTTGQCDARR